MDFFKKYVSNTLAGSANQSYFESDATLQTGRVYYKIFSGDATEYVLLFGDSTDNTFADGSHSVCNMPFGEWEIVSARAGTVKSCDMETATEPAVFTELTFNRAPGKKVKKGEVFHCDPFVLKMEKDSYLCVEIEFKGKKIPCHPEIIVPTFRKDREKFKRDINIPVPTMVGCKRKVKKRIGFLGDSITQGIGTTQNAYLHWNARLAEKLGEQNAFWNLGIGYSRSGDAASGGAWLEKVKQNDVVFLCLGVNDILQGVEPEEICANLEKITDVLQEKGIKVVLQTVPPFDYNEENTKKWNLVNDFIVNFLAGKADGFFDNRPVLSESAEKPQNAKYGGHPNDLGCAAWAEALYAYIKNIL